MKATIKVYECIKCKVYKELQFMVFMRMNQVAEYMCKFCYNTQTISSV